MGETPLIAAKTCSEAKDGTSKQFFEPRIVAMR